jgi:Lon protease-like protein
VTVPVEARYIQVPACNKVYLRFINAGEQDYQQDLHDSSREREHPSTARLSMIAPPDPLRLQVCREAEVFTSAIASLLKVSNSAPANLVHYSFSNASFA